MAYHASVFEGIGLLNDDVAKFRMDPDTPPVAAPYCPVPLAYREKLSKHLQELRGNNKIQDVDPAEHCTWISNVVISEKKDKQQIRMHIGMREPNKALKRTKAHVETLQEIRHKLQGGTRYSEMDLRHGFHQLAGSTPIQSTVLRTITCKWYIPRQNQGSAQGPRRMYIHT